MFNGIIPDFARSLDLLKVRLWSWISLKSQVVNGASLSEWLGDRRGCVGEN